MTPTLRGRWQTRLFLLGTVGVLITLLFGWLYVDFRTPLVLLGYVVLFGFGWDVLYHWIQSFRWDGDWPPIYQLIGGLAEGLLIWLLATSPFLRGGLPDISPNLNFARFASHYGTVWLVTFAVSQSVLKLIFPRWRFYGGEWM
jgi:hypothetical protein